MAALSHSAHEQLTGAQRSLSHTWPSPLPPQPEVNDAEEGKHVAAELKTLEGFAWRMYGSFCLCRATRSLDGSSDPLDEVAWRIGSCSILILGHTTISVGVA
jgi:hypothetical protein